VVCRRNTRNEDAIIGTKTGDYKRRHTNKRDHRITEEKTNTRNEDGIIGKKTGYYKRRHTNKRDHTITEKKTECQE
jgi:hypothetical protein